MRSAFVRAVWEPPLAETREIVLSLQKWSCCVINLTEIVISKIRDLQDFLLGHTFQQTLCSISANFAQLFYRNPGPTFPPRFATGGFNREPKQLPQLLKVLWINEMPGFCPWVRTDFPCGRDRKGSIPCGQLNISTSPCSNQSYVICVLLSHEHSPKF